MGEGLSQTQLDPQAQAFGDSQSQGDGASQSLTVEYRASLVSTKGGPTAFFSDAKRPFETITVGSGTDCTVVVDGDKRFSRCHFCVTLRHGHYFIMDKSSNGTYLNERRLQRNVEWNLSDGDIISLVVNPRKESHEHRITAQWKFKMPDEDPVESRFHHNYKLGQRLGRGTFSEVYSATRCKDGLWVAVKISERSIFENWRNSQNSTLEVDAEIDMVGSVEHPNCVKLLDHYVGNKRIFLVFEMCGGGDLLDYIVSGGAIPEQECKVYFRMIVEGLRYLHSRKIVHRDLKPENILLSDKGPQKIIKITDFGLARKINSTVGGAQTFCGTPSYFAPELIALNSPNVGVAADLQAETGNRYGLAVDIWSLGVVLYIMLSAAPPFGEDSLSVLTRPVTFTEDAWFNVSDTAKDLIRQLMRVNPSERLTVEGILQHPWMRQGQNASSSSSFGMVQQQHGRMLMESSGGSGRGGIQQQQQQGQMVMGQGGGFKDSKHGPAQQNFGHGSDRGSSGFGGGKENMGGMGMAMRCGTGTSGGEFGSQDSGVMGWVGTGAGGGSGRGEMEDSFCNSFGVPRVSAGGDVDMMDA
uniref:Uncharacterized protein n=1 Tax=Chromera velia CCMP2878 TaxID=1169474 RepID=A0A0G4GF60_9ALVE|eukprot:Cvel_21610.t1-p1 / transcript=Cvel_21610.t1 / gene=Cvel_21610 / organism=Chromera_velia_CCMP2878 / gene_product=Serine/threonine-protein kinase cds1, putative / transcript_product=Serine/threonine-protein kinase cds1, putative / location=Cvel_scaffold2041:11092-19444(+) / protein_length=582 / sequence_SO=supercontig / SO=protein_coding / is_pseudo=false